VGPEIQVIKPFGDVFIRLLKMIVMPVVFFSLTLHYGFEIEMEVVATTKKG